MYSLCTTPDIDDVIRSAGSTSLTPDVDDVIYSAGSTSLTPDVDDVICSAGSTLLTPFTSLAGSDKVKSEATSKMPSQASTPRSRLMSKCTLQDAFAKGSAKENQVLKCLGT